MKIKEIVVSTTVDKEGKIIIHTDRGNNYSLDEWEEVSAYRIHELHGKEGGHLLQDKIDIENLYTHTYNDLEELITTSEFDRSTLKDISDEQYEGCLVLNPDNTFHLYLLEVIEHDEDYPEVKHHLITTKKGQVKFYLGFGRMRDIETEFHNTLRILDELIDNDRL